LLEVIGIKKPAKERGFFNEVFSHEANSCE
jgi:hypothetical protein